MNNLALDLIIIAFLAAGIYYGFMWLRPNGRSGVPFTVLLLLLVTLVALRLLSGIN